MIEEILQSWKENTFDFREIACPSDPCRPLFERWIDYYRLKSSITQVLRPSSILEVGVRYGYSAAAFLNGHPATRYTGIDVDDASFGGVAGAIDWARKILPEENTVLIRGDTQQMSHFPGSLYDLIHLDGQQDGDGTFHDLEKALRQGRFILVDGFLWTSHNFNSINAFIRSNAAFIEYYCVIPGYAGEILIRVKERFLEESGNARRLPRSEGSLPLRKLYTSEYYLTDCGGWDTFSRTGGGQLKDSRLASVLDLTLLGRPATLLDLGCGRGEISFQAASRGCKVSAVDYSSDAIELAKNSFLNAGVDERQVTWVCGDATAIDLGGSYDVAVAGDLVEHLAPREVERLYENVARHLNPNGAFIVHTFPNKWYYQYEYERRRRLAASVGAYLPPDPRSRYEKQMHINEQSPRELKRQLKKNFKHVLLWFGSPEEPGGSLLAPLSPRQLVAMRDLYAVASQTPVNAEAIAALFKMNPLSSATSIKVSVDLIATPKTVKQGENLVVRVHLRNDSDIALNSHPPHPVHLSSHWINSLTGETILFEGDRTKLIPALLPFSDQIYEVSLTAPATTGAYLVQVLPVQEGVRWFDEAGLHSRADFLINVIK